jgi:hypothetical protein
MSHLHWLQARMANAIPAGVVPYRGADGQPPLRSVAPSELAAHATRDSLWLCVHRRVYDCTAYASRHPGGIRELLKGTGKDCSALFTAVHSWVNLDLLLGAAFLVGELGEEPPVGGAAVALPLPLAAGEQAEPPWEHLRGVRPLGAASAPAPAAAASAAAAAALSLPCAACRGALAEGSLVLWRARAHQGLCGAWPWGSTAGAQGGQLCVIARGRAALSLPALLAGLGLQGVRVVWDMRQQQGGQPWVRRAAEALQPLAAAVCVLQEEGGEGAGAAPPAPQPWAGALAVHSVRTGKDPLLQCIKGFPAPHAALLVLALAQEPSEEWEKEWDEELRAGYYAADLFLAATLPP